MAERSYLIIPSRTLLYCSVVRFLKILFSGCGHIEAVNHDKQLWQWWISEGKNLSYQRHTTHTQQIINHNQCQVIQLYWMLRCRDLVTRKIKSAFVYNSLFCVGAVMPNTFTRISNATAQWWFSRGAMSLYLRASSVWALIWEIKRENKRERDRQRRRDKERKRVRERERETEGQREKEGKGERENKRERQRDKERQTDRQR